MLWTGPWDLSSINSNVSYGVTLLPGYNGNHETISGPDLYMLFDHSSARAAAAVNFITWLTSAKVHIQFAIATGDLPLRESETKLPEYQTFLKKYPAEQVFVDNLNNVKHIRPNIASYARGVDGGRPDGAVGAARPGRAGGRPEVGQRRGQVGAGWFVSSVVDDGGVHTSLSTAGGRTILPRSVRRRQPGPSQPGGRQGTTSRGASRAGRWSVRASC